MAQAKQDDRVKIHYTGYLNDGTVFESTVKDGPVTFIIGEGAMIPGIEKALIGMNAGDIRSITVPPEDAYAKYNEKLVSDVDRSRISNGIDLKVGMKLRARTGGGILKEVTVRDISEKKVTVDANHPLAGQEVAFEIILLAILKK